MVVRSLFQCVWGNVNKAVFKLNMEKKIVKKKKNLLLMDFL